MSRHRGNVGRMSEYIDREDAGERLADALQDAGVRGDRVLAIPRGALPVGRRVADALDLPLGVLVARKIGHPEESDLAIGAVGTEGTKWIADSAVEKWDVDREYIEAEVASERETVRRKIERYADGQLPDIEGERVLIVDDGAATGATARACIEEARKRGAARVVLAVPVASGMAAEMFEDLADEFVCPLVPDDFGAVWDYYESFEQLPDERAVTYLR